MSSALTGESERGPLFQLRAVVAILYTTSLRIPTTRIFKDPMGNLISRLLFSFFGLIDISYALRNNVLDAMYEEVLLLPDEHPNKTRRLRSLNVAFLRHWGLFGDVADVNRAISAFEKAVPLASDVHKPAILGNLGVSFARRFTLGGDISDIEEGVSICKDAFHCTAEDHPDRPLVLTNLGNSHVIRFQHFGEVADIDNAVKAHDEALQRIPDGDPDIAGYLGNLGNSFGTRFQRFGEVADLDKAIKTSEEAVRRTPEGHPFRAFVLTILGTLLRTRFQRFGDDLDLDRAIKAHEDAVQRTPDGHPAKAGFLDNLGSSFGLHFQRLGEIADLDKAIKAHDEAVRLTPDGDLRKAGFLTDLGMSSALRFQQVGAVADLERSIKAHDEAVRLTPDGNLFKAGSLAVQGDSLGMRFQRYGDDLDLDKAIEAHNKAVQRIPDGDPHKAGFLAALGDMFGMRFQRYGDGLDLNKAMEAHNEALQYIPDGDPQKDMFLVALGDLFGMRFHQFGDIADLEKAIKIHEDGLQRSPDDHPCKAAFQVTLAMALAERFRLFGAIADIENAVSACDGALKITPDGSPHRARLLHNLGVMVALRFERFGAVADIDEAIDALEKVLQQIPDNDPFKADCLTDLCISYVLRFELHNNIADIDKAIAVNKKAAQIFPSNHPRHVVLQSQRCRAHANRYKFCRDAGDVESAISAGELSLRLRTVNDPQEPIYLTNLGNSYLYRFENLDDVTDINKAILHFEGAARCSTGSALERFRAALKWADCASRVLDVSLLEAYECALDLLPRVAWLGLPMAERHRELAKIGGAVRDAVAAAIAAGEYGKAVEWLEQGRSIVWGQLLHLRTPVDELRERKPELAARLQRVTTLLERASTRDIVGESSRKGPTQQPLELAREWEELVKCVRQVEGFEDFLLPKKLPQLRDAARLGPVVVINVHNLRCDALILRHDRDDVIHVPLDNFSIEQAQHLQKSLDELLSASGLRVRSERGTMLINRANSDVRFRNILSKLWTCVVNPVLESLALPVSQTPERPRIWWCATGPLAFLPLHAAGLYQEDEPGFKIEDFFASSYTPTLTALLDAQRTTTLHNFQLLAIAQPSTPGQSALPHTEQELIQIRKRAGNLPVITLEGQDATVERVVQGMKECGWIHLACHGTQNTTHPTKSALLLQDGGRLELSEIIKTPLPNAEFAFMSACQTATGDKDLSEEAVHLAAGMLLAGYRGIIATMWSIKDKDALLVADEVYASLLEDRQPDHTRAARALHQAVRHLREQNAPFASWVPFIHVGM